jgi:hypothetical protein
MSRGDLPLHDRVGDSLELLLQLLELLLAGGLHGLELLDSVVDGLVESLLVLGGELVAVLAKGVLEGEGVGLWISLCSEM